VEVIEADRRDPSFPFPAFHKLPDFFGIPEEGLPPGYHVQEDIRVQEQGIHVRLLHVFRKDGVCDQLFLVHRFRHLGNSYHGVGKWSRRLVIFTQGGKKTVNQGGDRGFVAPGVTLGTRYRGFRDG
jgi:hypothetical protein